MSFVASAFSCSLSFALMLCPCGSATRLAQGLAHSQERGDGHQRHCEQGPCALPPWRMPAPREREAGCGAVGGALSGAHSHPRLLLVLLYVHHQLLILLRSTHTHAHPAEAAVRHSSGPHSRAVSQPSARHVAAVRTGALSQLRYCTVLYCSISAVAGSFLPPLQSFIPAAAQLSSRQVYHIVCVIWAPSHPCL